MPVVALPPLVLPVLGCTPSAELAGRQAAAPEAVAAAVCREVRPAEASACKDVHLSDQTSQIAYSTCLDYNRRDLQACDRLRRAYENDIRAQLAAQTARPAAAGVYGRRAPGTSKPGEQQPSAEALYKAANSDADTFQAALLIPDIRKKIEAALGKPLSDAQLRALIDNNREEAVYWYGQMTHSQPARGAAEKRPGG